MMMAVVVAGLLEEYTAALRQLTALLLPRGMSLRGGLQNLRLASSTSSSDDASSSPLHASSFIVYF
ncbi:hypothetical protein BT93_G0830 [Corymbia citriodora subsp. variegata]|nr:hypothetical protein BT93_G0830 [Corymbia citriodora subsp. variegata]